MHVSGTDTLADQILPFREIFFKIGIKFMHIDDRGNMYEKVRQIQLNKGLFN